MHNLENIQKKEDILKHGYTIVKNVLSSSEVQSLRSELLAYFAGGDFLYALSGKAKSDAFNNIRLKNIIWLLQQESIINALKSIIIGEEIKFCHHSDIHMNIASGWHKDNTTYSITNPWTTTENGATYGVYKVAIYLQDHLSGSNYALKVKNSSHLTESLTEGETESLYTKAGDAIIFDCRITHMGQEDILLQNNFGKLLRNHGMKFIKTESNKYKIRQLYRRIMGIDDRLAIFFTFGKCNIFTDEHIKGNVDRQNQQNQVKTMVMSNEVIANLESVGIKY